MMLNQTDKVLIFMDKNCRRLSDHDGFKNPPDLGG